MCDRLFQITSNDFADLGFLDHLLTQAKELFCLYSFAQKRAFRTLFHLNMKTYRIDRERVGVITIFGINGVSKRKIKKNTKNTD